MAQPNYMRRGKYMSVPLCDAYIYIKSLNTILKIIHTCRTRSRPKIMRVYRDNGFDVLNEDYIYVRGATHPVMFRVRSFGVYVWFQIDYFFLTSK